MTRPLDTPTNGASKAAKKTLANSLVALSSAAVIAIYAAGYARTGPAAGQFVGTASVSDTDAGAAVSPTPTTPPTAASTATAVPANPIQGAGPGGPRGGRQQPGGAFNGGSNAAPTTSVAPTATATATTSAGAVPSTVPAATTGAFRDGTYTGTGTSRHGNIGVTVTVQAGKIVAAEISTCGTRYSCSIIAGLPGQAVARQSAAVDVVTGATDSTNAYRAAVNAALAQAR